MPVAKVIERKNEGSAYVAAIQSTADFHSKLKRIFNDDQEELSPEQIQQCNQYRSENESLKVQNTFEENDFWNQEITSSELKQVQKATKEYIAQVTPLLAEIQEE